MSTQEQSREPARPSEVDETKPERPAQTKARERSDVATTPHPGSARKVDPEELSPDDFE